MAKGRKASAIKKKLNMILYGIPTSVNTSYNMPKIQFLYSLGVVIKYLK